MKKICLLIIGLFFTPLVSAGVIFGGATVLTVRIDGSGFGIVTFSPPATGTPASCAVPTYANSLAFDANTEGGKAFVAAMVAAKMGGLPVRAFGLGTCAKYGIVEDLDYAVLL